MTRTARRGFALACAGGAMLLWHACAVYELNAPINDNETEAAAPTHGVAGARSARDVEAGRKPPSAPPPPVAGAYEPEPESLRGLGGAAAIFHKGSIGSSYGDQAQAAPWSFPIAGEELWIVAVAPGDEVSSAAPPATAYPELRCKRPGATEEIPLPLEHTDVKARIAAYIASVRVTQRYHNPYAEKIEAIYVFPLPPDAAASEFVMTIGDRHIRGIIREREEAERIYAEARYQGHVASLLTQERPNVFTQAVANIEPGKAIDIELTYFNSLRYEDGAYELVFPMVVGPRFNPPGSADGIGAVPRGDYGASGQAVEVHYLRPTERSGHDIALSVDIDAGVEVESVASPSHAIETAVLSPTRRRVTLSSHDSIPNQDFVLRYTVAGETMKSGLLVHHDERGGFFTLMLQPPAGLESLPGAPMEMVFVLDCSGSMSGTPLAIAKSAIERALARLGPDDTFQIVRFSDQASQLGAVPVAATRANVGRAREYLRGLESESGTMMIEGIKAALDFPHDTRRVRVVSFLTDGFIGNEAEILGEIQRRLGSTRIFSFGVGSSANRYLLDRMALLGNGAVAYVGLSEIAGRAADLFFERVSHPALSDISVDWGNLNVSEVYPRRVPDLLVGRRDRLDLTALRATAARFQGDVLVLVATRSNAYSDWNPLAASYPALVPMLIVPGNDLAVHVSAEACALDVRSAVILACAQGHGEATRRFVTMPGRDRRFRQLAGRATETALAGVPAMLRSAVRARIDGDS